MSTSSAAGAYALLRDPLAGRWFAFEHPRTVLAARAPGQVAEVIEEAEHHARRERLFAVGFLTYEAAPALDAALTAHPPGLLPPAWFALFRECRLAAPPAHACQLTLPWQATVDAPGYRDNIGVIRDYIAAGDTYQVNYSYRLRARLPRGGADPSRHLFEAMISRQPHGAGAFIDTGDWAICSASHELFFTRARRRVTSRPMKGTAPRGATPAEDADRARWLRASEKNRAENLMITDMVRNDLGRLADLGSVRTESLFALEAHPTLWQMTSTVCADTGASLADLFRALFPAASITGAPKRRTMQIIRSLEMEPREIYTGAIGLIRPGGDAWFNVAIRTALVDKRLHRAEYGVGGGIIWESDAEEELEETRTKARILEPLERPVEPFELLETIRWTPEQGFRLLDGHLERVQRAAAHFFSGSLEVSALRRRLDTLASGLPPAPHRIRLLVDRRLAVRALAEPLNPDDRPRGVVIAQSPAPVLGNPFVAHKTTRRGLYESARRALTEAVPAADDVLLINARGEITESTIANVVADLDGELVTPPVECGLLPGVFRQHLLDTGRITERVLFPEQVRRARAVYLANALRGLWQVELLAT